MNNNEIKDISSFILSKAVEQVKQNDKKDFSWQEGFTAGCRFMADIVGEFKNREIQQLDERRN